MSCLPDPFPYYHLCVRLGTHPLLLPSVQHSNPWASYHSLAKHLPGPSALSPHGTGLVGGMDLQASGQSHCPLQQDTPGLTALCPPAPCSTAPCPLVPCPSAPCTPALLHTEGSTVLCTPLPSLLSRNELTVFCTGTASYSDAIGCQGSQRCSGGSCTLWSPPGCTHPAVAHEIFPDQASNPHSLHCTADSQPPDHQGSLYYLNVCLIFKL